jgi:hypothetical protein
MTPAEPSNANETASSRKPRPRSTIGINPLDLSPLPTTAEDKPKVVEPPQPDERSELTDPGRGVFAAWAASTEGILEALLETQTATLEANLTALEAGAKAQQRIAHKWTEAARTAQAAALVAFHSAGRQATPPPKNSAD